MSEHSVYISCAGEDQRSADIIQSAIEKCGIRCESTTGISSGGDLSMYTETAIERSSVFIVVYSRHANASSALTREIEYAASRDIFLLPFRIEDTPMSQELEFYLSTYHWLNAVGVSPDNVLNELVVRVEALIAQTPQKPNLSITPDRPSLLANGIQFAKTFQTAFKSNPQLLKLIGCASAVIAILIVLRITSNERSYRLPNGPRMEFVWCPPGTFMMGSLEDERNRDDNETQHEVTLTKGFWLGKYEVTQEQWQAVMGTNPSKTKSGPKYPVKNVSWDDCQEFIAKLNDSVAGSFRLPSEAEWEYACRAGSTTMFYFGDMDVAERKWDRDFFNKSEAEKRSLISSTFPVGQDGPNPWGFYDMYGNVSEWCEDWFGDYTSGQATDPPGPNIGQFRVTRGGDSVFFPPNDFSAKRGRADPDAKFQTTGFRLCVSELPDS